MSIRKLFNLGIAGAMLGAVLAVAAPPTAANASAGCSCNDWGAGHYQCNMSQTACFAGSEVCQLTCL